MTELPASTMFPDGIRAVNVGLESFAGPLRTHGATVAAIEWRPPADGDRDLGLLLARLEDDPDDPLGPSIQNDLAVLIQNRLGFDHPRVIDHMIKKLFPGPGRQNDSSAVRRDHPAV